MSSHDVEPPEGEPSGASDTGESFRAKMREAEKQFKVFVSQVEAIVRERVGPMPEIIPADTKRHLANSKREALQAVRSLIDREIERMDRRDRETDKSDPSI